MHAAAGPPPEESRFGADLRLLTHDRQLGERLFLQTYVRLLLAVVIAAGAFVGRYLVGVGLDTGPLLALAAGMALYNAGAWALTRGHRGADGSAAERRRLLRVMYASILLDYVALSIAIWLVGGARSPFLPFLLLHVILTCLLLSRRAAIFFHFLAYGFLVALVALEWTGLVPPHRPEGVVGGSGAVDGRYALTVLVVYGVLFVVTAWLLLGFARMVRDGERRIRAANAELRKLSRARRDFLSIAVHNLRAPVGVAITFLRNLRRGLGGPVTAKQEEWIDRCLDRLSGLNDFMRSLQMLSSLEAGKLDADRVEIDVGAMLAALLADHRDQAEQHDHSLRLEVAPNLPPVRGIEVLLREAAANLVSNAIRYTPDGGHVTVRAAADGARIRIEVEDDGPGIPEEERERLFTEFHRGAAAGKTSGSGLGLAIVRRVAAFHGGQAFVESPGPRGSRFVLELPVSDGPAATR